VEIINLGKERWRLQDTQQHTAAPGAGSSAGAKQGAQGRGGPTRGSRGDGSGSQPSACALHEGTYGVLLDCCPTLALFHPTVTRHPQTWSSFSECLQVDVQSSRLGAIRLTLLEALGLGPANGALFFRKVAPLSRQGAAQLMACLQLLWRRKALPPTLEELVLVRQ
jgi:hypothetical protein